MSECKHRDIRQEVMKRSFTSYFNVLFSRKACLTYFFQRYFFRCKHTPESNLINAFLLQHILCCKMQSTWSGWKKLVAQIYVVSAEPQVETFSSALCFTAFVFTFHVLFKHSDIKHTFYIVFVWTKASSWQNMGEDIYFLPNTMCHNLCYVKKTISRTFHTYETGYFNILQEETNAQSLQAICAHIPQA